MGHCLYALAFGIALVLVWCCLFLLLRETAQENRQGRGVHHEKNWPTGNRPGKQEKMEKHVNNNNKIGKVSDGTGKTGKHIRGQRREVVGTRSRYAKAGGNHQRGRVGILQRARDEVCIMRKQNGRRGIAQENQKIL